MTVTNNSLIRQSYYKEEEYMNECVDGCMLICILQTQWGWLQSLRPRLLYAESSEVFCLQQLSAQ